MTDQLSADSQYDVIIVGGGPAGSSAAYFLGEAGKRVLVLEKARLPRYKTCGGGLSLRFLREQFPFSFDPIVKNETRAISYDFKGKAITMPLAPNAIGMVMRDDLDAYLLEHTRAEVIQGAAVKQVTELAGRVLVETQDGRCFSGGYLIGADGANSVVAHALDLRMRRTLAAAVEAEVRAPTEVMARLGQNVVLIFGEIHRGYLWIFPKAEHLTVGIGALRPKHGELQKTLREVMARYGISLENVPLRGHPIPIYTGRERVSSARTLLVGDAAGLADPLSGEGIRFAIKSGRLAAEALLEGRPELYARRLFWSIGFQHGFTVGIALIFYAIEPLCLFLGTRNPYSTQAIVDMLADRISTPGFVLLSAFTLPLFALAELAARGFHRLGLTRLAERLRDRVYPPAVCKTP